MPFIQFIRWQDVVDILLNSYILFRLYVLFRGTYVFRVITGIAFLWIFQRISAYFGLILTSWVMQGITAVLALIIIIVFRNEIRSVLQAKNLKAILWGFPQQSGPTTIQVIVDSVKTLSRRRIGALIVFPAKENLEDVLQGGIPLKGLISEEMITSIFWSDNPVHDGAVIIEGDRIAKVGVILPLSYKSDLPSRYGTRHRAALGLAETTDALVVVVSEETGKVVVAQHSNMINIHDSASLTKILKEHMGLHDEKERSYREQEKFKMGLAAVFSFLFITGMWVSFSKGLDTLITLEVPVEYTNRSPGFEIVDASVNTVRLHLGGSGTLIKSIQPEQVQVKLDLGHAVIGRNVFSITQDNITLPPGIFLRKVVPSVIEVTLDETIKKEIPVQVDWVGELPEGLILSETTIDPEKVTVFGGKRILNKISTIYTEKVHLDNLKESGTIIANLALTPASLKIASGSKDKIKIAYVINHRVK
jgi:diadenylate cyclase